MKKTLLAIALASSLTSLGAVAADKAPEPDFSISGNFGLTNDYRYRGVSQSKEKAAVSGGLDLTFKNGFYLGNWNSSISWLSSTSSSGLESDFYGGYRFDALGVSFDIGNLYYYYPGDNGTVKAGTNEVYVGISKGPFSFKTSYSTSNIFANANSDGSLYYDLTLALPISEKLSSKLHVGYNDIKNFAKGYDYLVGLSYDLGEGFALGVSYVTTTGDYKTLNAAAGNATDKTGLVSITKTF